VDVGSIAWPGATPSPTPMTAVVQCPETRLWLLPEGSGEFSRWLPSWHDLVPAARDVVLPLVRAVIEEDRRTGGPRPETRVLSQTFGLLPCPDNDWNSQAVAVVVPEPGMSLLTVERQIAWVKNDHLRSLQPSILALMDAADGPVGCRGLIELQRYVADEDYDGDEPPVADDPDEPSVLTEAESRQYQYTFGGFRANIDSWEPVRDAVLAFAADRVRDRILPLIGHRSPWSPEAKPVRDEMRAAGRTTVDLRAGHDVLDAYWGQVLVSRLHPDPREFFARTHQRVVALGGAVTAEAEAHAGSLEVFVQDSRQG
jgi:hypothetical protein